MAKQTPMKFDIRPSSEMTVNFGGARVGYLEGIIIDMGNKNMLGIPKVQLSVVLEEGAFENDSVFKSVLAICQSTGIIKLTILEE